MSAWRKYTAGTMAIGNFSLQVNACDNEIRLIDFAGMRFYHKDAHNASNANIDWDQCLVTERFAEY